MTVDVKGAAESWGRAHRDSGLGELYELLDPQIFFCIFSL